MQMRSSVIAYSQLAVVRNLVTENVDIFLEYEYETSSKQTMYFIDYDCSASLVTIGIYNSSIRYSLISKSVEK